MSRTVHIDVELTLRDDVPARMEEVADSILDLLCSGGGPTAPELHEAVESVDGTEWDRCAYGG